MSPTANFSHDSHQQKQLHVWAVLLQRVQCFLGSFQICLCARALHLLLESRTLKQGRAGEQNLASIPWTCRIQTPLLCHLVPVQLEQTHAATWTLTHWFYVKFVWSLKFSKNSLLACFWVITNGELCSSRFIPWFTATSLGTVFPLKCFTLIRRQNERSGKSPHVMPQALTWEGIGNSVPYLSQLSPYNILGEMTKLGRGAGAIWSRCVGGCQWGCSSFCWESPWPGITKEM